MNKLKLIEILNKNDVPHQSYSLDGLKRGECLCVINENGQWKVVYNSQGRLTSSIECSSEEAAYDEIYKQIHDAYGWK